MNKTFKSKSGKQQQTTQNEKVAPLDALEDLRSWVFGGESEATKVKSEANENEDLCLHLPDAPCVNEAEREETGVVVCHATVGGADIAPPERTSPAPGMMAAGESLKLGLAEGSLPLTFSVEDHQVHVFVPATGVTQQIRKRSRDLKVESVSVGMHVEVKWSGDGLWYPAEIVTTDVDGTPDVDIVFEDGVKVCCWSQEREVLKLKQSLFCLGAWQETVTRDEIRHLYPPSTEDEESGSSSDSDYDPSKDRAQWRGRRFQNQMLADSDGEDGFGEADEYEDDVEYAADAESDDATSETRSGTSAKRAKSSNDPTRSA